MLVQEFREKVFEAVSIKPKKQHLLLFGKKMGNVFHLLDYHVKVGAIVDITERVNLGEMNNVDLFKKRKKHELRRSH
jgi:hypothetical protein